MGLAASQCRFLMLTSRESDVEAKLMALSNQQMALTNKATKLSTDYAKALSAQDVNFNGKMVSYSSIMAPNMDADETGNISQYLFRSSKGQVILSPGMANKCGLTRAEFGSVGTAYQFKKEFPTKEKFLERVLSGYNANIGETEEGAHKLLSESGYRYDDSLMNNAVVTCESSSVQYLGDYAFDVLEYAMGTQEDLLSTYACIWTLDQFQYTDANVHSITNEFIGRCIDAMSAEFTSDNALGTSDAVNYALGYAKQKTMDYYSNIKITESGKNIRNTLTDLDYIKSGTSSPSIVVSNIDYSTTELISYDQGSAQYKVTDLTGKDIFVDTAQLTAVFLNYFDAGMLYGLVDGASNDVYAFGDEDVEYLKSRADAIKALNDDANPLQARLNKQQTGSMEGLNGYNKSNVEDKYSAGSSGLFGNTIAVQSNTGTSNSTLSAQKAFYGHMYDAMAADGWSYSDTIAKDNQFLSDQMQRQNIILYEYPSTGSSKGNALSLDDSLSGLTLVDSNARLEEAEAAYEAESAKIDYKTSIIEAQMDTLNTELTSIQSEKESVQAIIDKKIEKFNLFG